MKMLNGRKTYLCAVLMIIYAISGALLDKISGEMAGQIILEALIAAGLRNAIKN